MPDRQLSRCMNVDDVRELARRKLPQPLYDLMSSGVEDGVTFRRNTNDFQKYEIDRRVLLDVSTIATAVRVLGCELSFPLILSPTGAQGLFHPGGEVAAARAAAKAGVMYSYPTFGHFTPEEVADVGPGSRMLQLYAYIDDHVTHEFIRRAKESKYNALCLTVDQPVTGRLDNWFRWGLSMGSPPPLRTSLAMLRKPAWIWSQRRSKQRMEPIVLKLLRARGHRIPTGTPTDLSNWAIRRDLTWEDAAAFRRRWDGPFVIKGITNVDDARKAFSMGATAIVVCNHGGVALDGSSSSISILDQIVDAVGGNMEVLLGSGVQRGTSILKALGLGAKATLIGRPFLYGLAAAGEAGVSHVIELLRTEFETALCHSGCVSPAELSRGIVRRKAA